MRWVEHLGSYGLTHLGSILKARTETVANQKTMTPNPTATRPCFPILSSHCRWGKKASFLDDGEFSVRMSKVRGKRMRQKEKKR